MVLSHAKYINNLLLRAHVLNANGALTPILNTLKLNKFGPNVFSHPHHYISIVGDFQYVTLTCPDISYTINKACQFMTPPLTSHWTIVIHILRHLSGTVRYGLKLIPTELELLTSLRA